VPITPEDDPDMLEWLYDVVSQERANIEQNRWDPPVTGETPQRLCQQCGLRWNCPSVKETYPWTQKRKNMETEDALKF